MCLVFLIGLNGKGYNKKRRGRVGFGVGGFRGLVMLLRLVFFGVIRWL